MGFWGDLGDAAGVLTDKVFGSGELTDAEKQRKALMEEQARKAGSFADQGQISYGQLGRDQNAVRQRLADMAAGKHSIATEQLRQGTGQQLAAQQAAAAGAHPNNAAMAARTAQNNMARAQYGMAGQAALAGIQERNAANQTLGQMNLEQRGQDLQAALQSRQQAMGGYNQQYQTDQGWLDKYGPAVIGAVSQFPTGGGKGAQGKPAPLGRDDLMPRGY